MASQDIKNKINDYLNQVNLRFLNAETEYYDAETKTYNVGVFYVHEGLNYFEIRQVTDEKGDYTVIGEGEYTAEECLACLAGLYEGYTLTLDLLDLEYQEQEISLENVDSADLTEEGKAAARKMLEEIKKDIEGDTK